MDHLRLVGFGITALVLFILAGFGGRKRNRYDNHPSGQAELERRIYPEEEILRVKKITPNGESIISDYQRAIPSKKAEPILAENEPKSIVTVEEPKKEMYAVYHLMAPTGRPYAGYELLQALISVGLRYGENQIFHRYQKAHSEGTTLFSVAQATKPGTFDVDEMGGLFCLGLTFFMRYFHGEDISARQAMMMETISELADELGGTVLDSQRRALEQVA